MFLLNENRDHSQTIFFFKGCFDYLFGSERIKHIFFEAYVDLLRTHMTKSAFVSPTSESGVKTACKAFEDVNEIDQFCVNIRLTSNIEMFVVCLGTRC